MAEQKIIMCVTINMTFILPIAKFFPMQVKLINELMDPEKMLSDSH